MPRVPLLLCAALAALSGLEAADGEAFRARTGGRAHSHWHVGPFFEYRAALPRHIRYGEETSGDYCTYFALRPFYSHVRDAHTDTLTRDFIWPLGTYHRHGGATWWRALIAWGDAREDEPTWSADLFPLWFSGVTRDDAGYWGLFPLYGHHPHTTLMDDWTFALWPVWHTYTVKGVRSHAVLWPLVTWRDAPRAGVGVWPLYGQARQRESDHWYALWPFFNWASYEEDRDTSGAGFSWMFLPVAGEVRRARERQAMFLPPLFTYTRTDDAIRWRLPWPLVEVARSTTRDRVSVWPLWEQARSYAYPRNASVRSNALARAQGPVEERVWRVGWQLVENTELETATTREKRFNLFPFFTWERRWLGARAKDPAADPDVSYLRVWPFYSRAEEGPRVRQRALELNPIRHSEGFDRNWSPFWTFWTADTRPGGRTRHAIFWNLATWHTDPKAAAP